MALQDVPAGVLLLVVGVVLCFAGVRSLRLTGLCAGFALGWALAHLLQAGPVVGLVVAVAGAIIGLVFVSFVFRWAMWLLGGVADVTIAIKISVHVALGQGNALVAVLFAAAVGVITGFLADRHRRPLLAALTALSGASVVVNAVGTLFPTVLGFLDQPTTSVESVVATCAWVLLALAGWLVQRRALQPAADSSA